MKLNYHTLPELITKNAEFHSAYDDDRDEYSYEDPEESIKVLKIANTKLFCNSCYSEKIHFCLKCIENKQDIMKEEEEELDKKNKELDKKNEELDTIRRELTKNTYILQNKELIFNEKLKSKNREEVKIQVAKDLLTKGKTVEEIKQFLDNYKDHDNDKLNLIAQMIVQNKTDTEINEVLYCL